jgi:hypothetical protein
MNAPPYPADTRAKGWRFEVDYERVLQSDTWALASARQRPLLLMLWFVAWQQTPAGSLPDSDDLIAARIGMTTDEFAQGKPILMRGWWKASDGRIYHAAVTEIVLEMVERKSRETQRKANYRTRIKAGASGEMSHGTDAGQTRTGTGQTRESHGSDATVTSTSYSEDKSSGGEPPKQSAEEVIFSDGLALLTTTGTSGKQARSFLGGLRKQHGDDAVVAVIRDCMKVKPMQPIEWLAAAMRRKQGKPRKHENFDLFDYGTGGKL